MMDFLGESKVFHKACALGLTTADIRPPEGFEWIVNYFYLVHDDDAAGGIPCYWQIYDRRLGQGAPQPPVDDLANDTPLYLYDPHSEPYRFDHYIYPVAIATVHAAKRMFIYGMYLERPANVDLIWREWYSELVNKPLPAGMLNLRDRIDKYRGGL